MMDFAKRLLGYVITLTLTVAGSNAQDRPVIHGNDMPKNIILIIGDGMGLSHIQAGLTANYGRLNLLSFNIIGFSKTHSASDYVTDSGAGATAMATGHKTYNGAISVGVDSLPLKTILEYAEEEGLSTGLVSTSAVTHATPAAFIAHNVTRNDYEGIAADFLKTDIDVFIGGGINHFTRRKDHRNLVQELRDKGYQVMHSIDSIRLVRSGKLAGLTAPEHNPGIVEGRSKAMLATAAETAINVLSTNKKGFFLMIEGSQIDWGAHANNTGAVAQEVIDLDKVIGIALSYAKLHKNTLVIVTADHETGGMAITNGNYADAKVSAVFGTTNHTGLMVPLFAYGPGAFLFQGFQENRDIFNKMMLLYGFKSQEHNSGKLREAIVLLPMRIMTIIGFLLTALSCIPREDPPGQTMTLVAENNLPEVLRENSGMTAHDGLIWFINDSGNDSALYGYSRQQNAIIRTVRVKNSTNTDWEEITQNEQHIFIGDFGNNATGNRTDLRIYIIDKADLADADSVIPSGVIRFSYEDQEDFTPQDENSTAFDCEAFIATGNTILLFTKDWKTYQTRVYHLETTPGIQVARFHHEWKVDGLITGAAAFSDKLYLIGYGFNAMPFIWEYTGFEAATLHYDDRVRTDFNMDGITQTEAITVLQDGTVLVSSEEFNLIPPGSPATLFVMEEE